MLFIIRYTTITILLGLRRLSSVSRKMELPLVSDKFWIENFLNGIVFCFFNHLTCTVDPLRRLSLAITFSPTNTKQQKTVVPNSNNTRLNAYCQSNCSAFASMPLHRSLV